VSEQVVMATCPKHGPREFRRYEACSWWECSGGGDTCTVVIPDEGVTPDGAEVVDWGSPDARGLHERRLAARSVAP